MILDSIENIASYFTNTGWTKAMDFLKKLSPDCEDGEYEIEGDAVFARVMTYDTRDINEASPEAHIKYVDIQVVLSGEERTFWYPFCELKLKTPYHEKNDVAFYEKIKSPFSEMTLAPGLFAAFFPQDGHMPSISPNEIPTSVKKVVVKIAAEYFV